MELLIVVTNSRPKSAAAMRILEYPERVCRIIIIGNIIVNVLEQAVRSPQSSAAIMGVVLAKMRCSGCNNI